MEDTLQAQPSPSALQANGHTSFNLYMLILEQICILGMKMHILGNDKQQTLQHLVQLQISHGSANLRLQRAAM